MEYLVGHIATQFILFPLFADPYENGQPELGSKPKRHGPQYWLNHDAQPSNVIYNIQCIVIRIYENILQKLLKDLLQCHLYQGNLVPLQLLDESRLTGQQEYHRAPGRT
jgi:hypothetical protein